uniref:NADH-ubiquinone oxidoreductase chain 3 n=1 Tax=Phascolosoma esculenta TaxID=419950 RepID=C3PUI5_9ANNE|nr:NADH dehydrogenase subunit 3 [Phascolosoma esculenta]ABQ52601.1 NADH dehydrogenase subunit 3 [Phascolosoma esculenta]AWK60896.1 NADH dehydrogenase subunit 3 [Phascolosoma esculenta]
MLLTYFSIILAMTISFLLLIMAFSVSARSNLDREKQSPFECGFDPKSSARLPFSLRFFLLSVIFLVFDVEIALLLPIPVAIFWSNWSLLLCVTIFLLILSLGTVHEWNQGSLNWVYNKHSL